MFRVILHLIHVQISFTVTASSLTLFCCHRIKGAVGCQADHYGVYDAENAGFKRKAAREKGRGHKYHKRDCVACNARGYLVVDTPHG